MDSLIKSIKCFKNQVILIAGGKENEELDYEPFTQPIVDHARVLVLVGESKERMNRALENIQQPLSLVPLRSPFYLLIKNQELEILSFYLQAMKVQTFSETMMKEGTTLKN